MDRLTKNSKKITWEELEAQGLDEELYLKYSEAMNNIELLHKEVFELFERTMLYNNSREEFKNLIQFAIMLENEMEKAIKIINEVVNKKI